MKTRQASDSSSAKADVPISSAVAPLALWCADVASDDGVSVEDRQSRIPGFSQEALSSLKVVIAGAGAMAGEIAEGLVRKGVGELQVIDFDTVGLTNLNRQFFMIGDVGSPKAYALVRNLEPHGAMGTRLVGWPISFEEALAGDVDLDCDVIVAAVDDARTRIRMSIFARERGIPAIFGGASVDASYAYVFVQEPNAACFGCAFPDEARLGRNPCPGSPAVKDTFKALGALALYAIDSLLMERSRDWNHHAYCPANGEHTRGRWIPRSSQCPLCGGASA